MTDGPVTLDVEVWAARRLVDQHRQRPDAVWATGRCAHCPPDGDCQWLSAAQQFLAQVRVR